MAPENTAMAFEKAVEAGCDGLETDVIIRSVCDCGFDGKVVNDFFFFF